LLVLLSTGTVERACSINCTQLQEVHAAALLNTVPRDGWLKVGNCCKLRQPKSVKKRLIPPGFAAAVLRVAPAELLLVLEQLLLLHCLHPTPNR
jgi:hypothetical protein